MCKRSSSLHNNLPECVAPGRVDKIRERLEYKTLPGATHSGRSIILIPIKNCSTCLGSWHNYQIIYVNMVG